MSWTVVLPTGEIIRTGVETAKGVVGYDLTRLLVGSEGTLAVITDITLRLIPKPAARKTMISFFEGVSQAVRTVADIIGHKIIPTALEFMDRTCIDCVREEMRLSIPAGCGALLLIEVDGDAALTRREAKKIGEICLRGGAIRFRSASGPKEAEKLWEGRRNISPALYKLRPDKVSEDIVVPRSRMAELVQFLEEMAETYGLHLAYWANQLPLELEFECAKYQAGLDPQVYQALEDTLWDEMSPMFGRKGAK